MVYRSRSLIPCSAPARHLKRVYTVHFLGKDPSIEASSVWWEASSGFVSYTMVHGIKLGKTPGHAEMASENRK